MLRVGRRRRHLSIRLSHARELQSEFGVLQWSNIFVQLFMLGMRVLHLSASFFGASETARLGDVNSLTMSSNRLKAIEDGAFAHLNLHITFNELGATSPLTANVLTAFARDRKANSS